MKNFLLTLVIEGLEDKYNILLARGMYSNVHYYVGLTCIYTCMCMYMYICIFTECTVLKNRKFVGALPEQTVRQKAKPFIIEVDK